MIGVGAAFDFHAGIKPQAPSWLQRLGLEWFFRLLTEPRRLWKRYLYHNPRFLVLALFDLLGFVKRES
jgi:N-acetylglucosaminyldiphosphoundecaprenol N-acetyl-beta-D-mannosaminyltransferase